MNQSGHARYLLYDASCGTCRRLVEAAANELSGWATALPLQDPIATELLDRAGRSGMWQPAIVTVSDARVTVRSGIRMRSHLAWSLGPIRAARLHRVLRSVVTRQMTTRDVASRRSFLAKTLSATATTVLASDILGASALGRPRLGRSSNLEAALADHPTVRAAMTAFGPALWSHAAAFNGGFFIPLTHPADPAQATYLLLQDSAADDDCPSLVLRLFADSSRPAGAHTTWVAHYPNGLAIGAFTSDGRFAGVNREYQEQAATQICYGGPCGGAGCAAPSVSPFSVTPQVNGLASIWLVDDMQANEAEITAWANEYSAPINVCVATCLALYALAEFTCIGSCTACANHPSPSSFDCLSCVDCMKAQGEYHAALLLCLALCSNRGKPGRYPKICFRPS